MKLFGIQLELFSPIALIRGDKPNARRAGVSALTKDGSRMQSIPNKAETKHRLPVRTQQQKARIKGGSASCPRLRHIWLSVRNEYFPHRHDLDDYVLAWSGKPQKRTLASCNIKRRRVQVAREMDHEAAVAMLEPLLYHEMCHAVLGMSVVRETQRSQWHGREFRALERRHPMMPQLDHWVKSGGWQSVVRSDRGRRSWASRRQENGLRKIS